MVTSRAEDPGELSDASDDTEHPEVDKDPLLPTWATSLPNTERHAITPRGEGIIRLHTHGDGRLEARMAALLGETPVPTPRGHRHSRACGCATREELSHRLGDEYVALVHAYKQGQVQNLRKADQIRVMRADLDHSEYALASMEDQLVVAAKSNHRLEGENKALRDQLRVCREQQLQRVWKRMRADVAKQCFRTWKWTLVERAKREAEKHKIVKVEAEDMVALLRMRCQAAALEMKEAEQRIEKLKEQAAASIAQLQGALSVIGRVDEQATRALRDLEATEAELGIVSANMRRGRGSAGGGGGELASVDNVRLKITHLTAEVVKLQGERDHYKGLEEKRKERVLAGAVARWVGLAAHGLFCRWRENARDAVWERYGADIRKGCEEEFALVKRELHKVIAEQKSTITDGENHARLLSLQRNQLVEKMSRTVWKLRVFSRWRMLFTRTREREAAQRVVVGLVGRASDASLTIAFSTWARIARDAGEVRRALGAAEKEVMRLRGTTSPLEKECAALRIFRDALLSNQSGVVLRQGGGYEPLERWADKQQRKLKARARAGGKSGGYGAEEASEYWGLSESAKNQRYWSWTSAPRVGTQEEQGRGRGGRGSRGGGVGPGGGDAKEWAQAATSARMAQAAPQFTAGPTSFHSLVDDHETPEAVWRETWKDVGGVGCSHHKARGPEPGPPLPPPRNGGHVRRVRAVQMSPRAAAGAGSGAGAARAEDEEPEEEPSLGDLGTASSPLVSELWVDALVDAGRSALVDAGRSGKEALHKGRASPPGQSSPTTPFSAWASDASPSGTAAGSTMGSSAASPSPRSWRRAAWCTDPSPHEASAISSALTRSAEAGDLPLGDLSPGRGGAGLEPRAWDRKGEENEESPASALDALEAMLRQRPYLAARYSPP